MISTQKPTDLICDIRGQDYPVHDRQILMHTFYSAWSRRVLDKPEHLASNKNTQKSTVITAVERIGYSTQWI